MDGLQIFSVLLNFLSGGGLTKHGPLSLPPLDDDPVDDEDDEDDDDDEEDEHDDEEDRAVKRNARATAKAKAAPRLNAWGYPSGQPLSAAELEAFGRHFEVSLVDPATRLNLLATVSRAGAAECAREAAASVAWLKVRRTGEGGKGEVSSEHQAIEKKTSEYTWQASHGDHRLCSMHDTRLSLLLLTCKCRAPHAGFPLVERPTTRQRHGRLWERLFDAAPLREPP